MRISDWSSDVCSSDLLNSDVVPADDRWLPALRRRLGSGESVGAVGPKLLYGDDSLQHAGLTFAADERGRYYNTPFFKGYPRAPIGRASCWERGWKYV